MHIFYCCGCGVVSENRYWVVCRCRHQKVYQMAIRNEDADQIRAAIRRGGRVRVGPAETETGDIDD